MGLVGGFFGLVRLGFLSCLDLDLDLDWIVWFGLVWFDLVVMKLEIMMRERGRLRAGF